MTTEELQEAYGDRWPEVKDHVDSEGWFPDDILGDEYWVLSECERKCGHDDKIYWRTTNLN